jgi:colicin import membrane protein
MADEQEGQKDSSFMFSLKELAGLEEDRINQEQRTRQQEEARKVREREEQERRAREAEEARIAAEHERQRLEEQQQREESARLEAMRAAEIERQRVEAEQRARLEAMQQQQAHAQQLELIRQDQSKKKLRWAAYGAAALFLLTAVGGVGIYVKLQNEAKAEQIMREASARQAEADQQRTRAEYQKALDDISDLKKRLQSTTNEVDRQKLERQLKELNQHAPPNPVGKKPAGTPNPGGKREDDCPPGSLDPMCGKLR